MLVNRSVSMHGTRAKKNSQMLHARQFFLSLFAVHLCHHSLHSS